MAEFNTPEFLLGHSPDDIFQDMKNILPADIDLSEGGHAWNMTRPTALVTSKIYEFVLPEVIKLIFPEHSYGEFLDGHAKIRGLTRREATPASGVLHITGEAGTIIQAGNLFSTAAVNDEPSVDFRALTSARITSSGEISLRVQCTQAGTVGNAPAHTVVLVSSKITGIKSVTNPNPMSGGTEEESDEMLIERITVYDQSQGNSFVGSAADYKRWAMEVDGVGEAKVISATDTSGMIRIIITDGNGAPATVQLCTDVYNHIMRPDNPDERLAPPNANLTVQPPATMEIAVRATVELSEGATIESVKEAYRARLAAYLPLALEDGEIKYSRIAAALAATDGANDYSGLEFGVKKDDPAASGTGSITYGTANIPITTNQLPTVSTEDLRLTSGTV